MQSIKAVAVLVALVFFVAPVASGAQETSLATITVTGQADVSHAPDRATVAATIVTSNDNAQAALSENNRRFAALGTRLATLGITASAVHANSLSSYFSPRPNEPGAPSGPPGSGQLYGFIVTRNVGIDVDALEKSGAVVDAATAAGATQINGVDYGLRDRRAVERMALAAAVADAYAQAQSIAAAAHVGIVRVLRIGNDEAPRRYAPLAMNVAARAPEAPVPTSISPSDLVVSATVTVTYVIH